MVALISLVRGGNDMQKQIIYNRQGYTVEAVVTSVLVRGRDGAVLFRFKGHEVEEAIETADEIAEREGVAA
jgi:hypothetical protein